jgi:CheY-like chemotaxis protein
VKRPRVLLVDDLPEVVRYCSSVLEADYEIIGSASNGKEAIHAVTATEPDVIVLDISMPELDGIEVARRLRSAGCRAAIVFLSADDALSEEAIEAGGSAYVSKRMIDSDLRAAIAEALAGRHYVALWQGRGKESK